MRAQRWIKYSRVGESGDCCVLAACAAAAACLCVATALEHNSQMGCRTPIASFPAADKVAFSCGSSWEVDLRSDADCNQPGLERCHPRYTLGWQHREVQLHRDGLALPSGTELVHAYCDVWQRGRHEQVLASPAEKSTVRRRAAALQQRTPSNPQPTGHNVLLVVVRGLAHDQTRMLLPRTLHAMRRLRRQGHFRGAAFPRFAAASESGAAVLRALVNGVPQAASGELPRWASNRSLWRAYARRGYVTAFGEAGCATAASHAAGYSLEGEKDHGIDHVLVEHACALDTQLKAERATVRGLRGEKSSIGDGQSHRPSRGMNYSHRRTCESHQLDDIRTVSVGPLLSYMRTFMDHKFYEALPKFAMLVIPEAVADGARAQRTLDVELARFVTEVLTATPRTVFMLTSDVVPPPPEGATMMTSLWATPALRVLLPFPKSDTGADKNGTASSTSGDSTSAADAASVDAAFSALLSNAALPSSALDLHATLTQLPLLALLPRLPNRTLPATCGSKAMGGCSLLRPLPIGRSCMDTLAPSVSCTALAMATATVKIKSRSLPASSSTDSSRVQLQISTSESVQVHQHRSESLRLLQIKLRDEQRRKAGTVAARRPRSNCGAVRRSTCVATVPAPDVTLLSKVGKEADMFACDAPTFARLEHGLLTLDCPPQRMPLYQIGLHPKLHVYTHPIQMPNGTEYVQAYCYHADANTSACGRIGREHKPSNHAAIRRQCPSLSHGWVMDAAVENRRDESVAQRAIERRRAWAAQGAAQGLPPKSASDSPTSRSMPLKSQESLNGLNVLLLMLDSISAARFRQGMPITYALLEAWSVPSTDARLTLKKRRQRRRKGRHQFRADDVARANNSAARRSAALSSTEPLGPGTARTSSVDSGPAGGWRSFRFDLFTVVGSNSPRNQFPMLSGLTSLQWARDHGGRAHECIVPGFDDGVRASREHRCNSWIFDDYRASGYITSFSTNMCDWGVMEEVYPFDTRHPPTDHHLMEPWCHVDYDVDKLYFRPMTRCLGGRPAHAPIMKYELDLLANYRPQPVLSWTVYLEGHEPSFRAMANLDADLATHLLRLRELHGERTAILLVSDHGIHYGKYYDGARAGQMEHSLPLFYALVPRAVLAQHPDVERALCINQQRLVSPFDVHATLRALLSHPHRPSLPDWSGFSSAMRPRSLLSEVPAERTCDEAGVPGDACPCS